MIKILRTTGGKEFAIAVQSLMKRCPTIRGTQFLTRMSQDTKYSETEGRPVFIGLLCDEIGHPLSVAVAKAQNRKRGVWGRYATLTYAYTDWASRRQGLAQQLCRAVLDETGADRIKSLAASRQGLELHRSLGHQFWGLNEEGKVIVDSPLAAADLEGVPPQVRSSGGVARVSYAIVRQQYQDAHPTGYGWRDDPEEYLLNGAVDGAYGYKHLSAEGMLCLRADSLAGEMLRWENRKGTYVKKPSIGELSGLVCFQDTTLPHPWMFAGHPGGPLVYRVTVSKKGEHRPAR